MAKINRMKNVVTVLACVFTLSACEKIQAALHLMPHQNEQECLDSERFNFKDPDVVFVANLGTRGSKFDPDKYWVRYKAKNSYGAYLQGNMVCEKNSGTGKWSRSKIAETIAYMDVKIALLKGENEVLTKCPKTAAAAAVAHCEETLSSSEIEKIAYSVVFTSADDLSQYYGSGKQ